MRFSFWVFRYSSVKTFFSLVKFKSLGTSLHGNSALDPCFNERFSHLASDPPSLLSFHHSFNSQGDLGALALAAALQTNSSLTALFLVSTKMGDAGACALAKVLRTKRQFSTLSLSSNAIGEPGAAAIGKIMRSECCFLSMLILSKNKLGDSGAAALAEALCFNSSLTSLDLSFNAIGDAGGMACAKALQSNFGLISLDLSWNRIGNASAIGFGQALQSNSRLESFNLSWNNSIGDAGGVAIVCALEHNPCLVSLYLNSERIGHRTAQKASEVLSLNSSLTTLVIHDDHVPLSLHHVIERRLQTNSYNKRQRSLSLFQLLENILFS